MKQLSNAFILKILREAGMPVIIFPESLIKEDDEDSDEIDDENFVLEGLNKRNKRINPPIRVLPVMG